MESCAIRQAPVRKKGMFSIYLGGLIINWAIYADFSPFMKYIYDIISLFFLFLVVLHHTTFTE